MGWGIGRVDLAWLAAAVLVCRRRVSLGGKKPPQGQTGRLHFER